MPEFRGLKLCQDDAPVRLFGCKRVNIVRRRDLILTEVPGFIGDGGNSGFQALNIAVQFGAKRIVLVGFDMRLDRGVHWHGKHPRGMNNPHEPNVFRWRKALDGAADTLAALGVTVLNASPVSALTAYPIVDLRTALEC